MNETKATPAGYTALLMLFLGAVVLALMALAGPASAQIVHLRDTMPGVRDL